MEPSEERVPVGVPIQTIAYKCGRNANSGAAASEVIAMDSRNIKVLPPETLQKDGPQVLSVDHVYQNCGEQEIMDRSLSSIVSAYVEGVHSCVLSCGSSNTNHTSFMQGDSGAEILGIAGIVLKTVFDALREKDQSGRSARNGPYTYFIRMTYLEFYEGVITDLLNPLNKHLVIAETTSKGIHVKSAQKVGPIRFVDDALELLKQGRMERNSSSNAHGPVLTFSSTLLKLDLTQVVGSADTGQATTNSSLYLVDLPSTERLSRPPASVRMAEGPLLNKTLHAIDSVLRSLSKEHGADFASYSDSSLTNLLRHPLGGNCLTLAVLFFADNDYEGSYATVHLGQLLQGTYTYPVVNNEMMQGLGRRQNSELIYLREEMLTLRDNDTSIMPTSEAVEKIHELEGKLIRENLEKIKLKEDKEKIIRTVSDFRTKYQALVESKSSIQKQLIETEEEKLRVSKAYLDLQLENNSLMEKTEQDKYEVVTKLLNAENDILELEMREETKEQNIRELTVALEKATDDKKELAMEFVSLKTNYVNLTDEHKKECQKTQQLGVELLTLANQRKTLQKQKDELQKFKNGIEDHLQDLRARLETSTKSEATLNEQRVQDHEQIEQLRTEKAKVDLELQSAMISFESKRLEIDKNTQDFARDRDSELLALQKNMENEIQRVQNQRAEHMQQIKHLEGIVRSNKRQAVEFEVALERRSEEINELMAKNADIHNQMKEKEESFRNKLLEYIDLYNTTEQKLKNANDNEGSEVKKPKDELGSKQIDVLRKELTSELMQSFKDKERESSLIIHEYRQNNHLLLRKNRVLYEKFRQLRYILEDTNPGMALPDLPPESELKAGNLSEIEEEAEQALVGLREKLNTALEELSVQQEKNLHAAEKYKQMLIIAENKTAALQDDYNKLRNEKDRILNDLNIATHTPSTGVETEKEQEMRKMQEMQKLLLQKVQELREINAKQNATVDGKNTDTNEVIEMLHDKLRYARGSNNQAAELEEAERRCASFMTRYYMVQKELDAYKQHMKDQTAKYSSKIKHLEKQIKA